MNRLKILLQYDAGKYIHLGLIAALYILSYSSYLAIALLIVEIYILARKSRRLLLIGMFLILALTFRIQMVQQVSDEPSFPLTGTVSEVFDDSFYLNTDEKILCYTDRTQELKPGMIVSVEGSFRQFDKLNIMNTFDYDLYLKSQNIDRIIYVSGLLIEDKSFHLLRIRYEIQDYFQKHYEEETATYLNLFVLGVATEDFEQNLDIAREIGVSHVFAISGMHIGLLVGLIVLILRRFHMELSLSQTIIIVFLIVYNIILGGKPSVIRASFLIFGIYLKDRFDILLSRTDLVAFSFLGFLMVNPYVLFSLGFQLSYLVASTILLSRHIYEGKPYLKSLVIITLLSTVISLPIILSVNQEIGLVFPYANIFFISYVSLVFLPATFFILIVPQLESVYGLLIRVFESVLRFFHDLNVLIQFQFPTAFHKTLFWIIIVMMILFISNRKRIITLTMALSILIVSSFLMNLESGLFVRFLDVGQGDSIHVHDWGCDILIDTGKPDSYNTLIQYFKSYNVRSLDAVVITHFHDDHYGEINDLITELDIGTIYANKENTFIESDYEILSIGDEIQCGQTRFLILNAETGSTNENNNSIVLYAIIGGDRYLFTGDIESGVEADLLARYHLSVDILKVAHHGSDTSSMEEFLEATAPNIAVISVGWNNRYGLPNQAVVKRFEDQCQTLYRTDEDGTITIYYWQILHVKVTESYRKQKLRQYRVTMV